ncbi:protein mono-ADP-ribosyltransferase PARP12-like isoform X2 [Rhineura floridana]|uniref:protein mono-ADP-ribosyltransferase PARP12-like isoform X2 n=1 Tax=Rhineura floridana TaxID=261503 RepID=UPI002AC81D2A|nr:protein mono-ADP-ribosyltransferase PARP12-like isoform X2 [Rhineura floridana]
MDCFTSQRLARQALKELCASGGCLEKGELCRRVAFGLNPDFMEVVFKDAQKFTLVTREETPSAAESENPLLVVATTKARLCPDHGNGTCEGRCRQLHLCRYFVCGGCRHEGTRRQCKFIHDFHSPHNLPILKEHGLESLKNDELCQLLLQNDSSLLPEVCPYYNKGDGPYGSCNFKKICVKLHICQYSLQGECRFGSNCKRSHDIFNSECYEKLEKRGMSKALISKISLTYRNAYAIKNNTSSPCKERRESSGQVPLTTNSREESDTICLYHIRKSCSFQEKCIRVHFQFPYRWQIFDGTHWKDLTNMEKIEQAYCDPFNDRFSFSRAGKSSNHPDIIFSNMACGPAKIRRLSTASSVTKPPHYILTTDWIWYWKDEYGVWNEYGKQDADHAAATLSSLDLEKAYQSEASPTLTFSAGKHKYEIDFKAMKQKNLHYLTVRSVHRRPRFVSLKEVEKKKTSGAEQSKGGTTHIPTHWDQSALPDQGYKLITLSPSSNEYRKVQVNFQRTMPKSTIVYIKRIQNLALWEVYKWQKEQMKKANGGKDVDERLLFHGTSKDYIDAICVQNFDWRICGIHGTAYGKGSYFARDASYSDNYSKSNSSLKTMFLARVLVGEFTSGVSSYLRPPAKDSQNTFFYDSCVNSPLNPSIFVIFEKHQVYPEYLIEYTN